MGIVAIGVTFVMAGAASLAQQPTKFELVINLKAAKRIGLNDSGVRAVPGGQGHKMIANFGMRILDWKKAKGTEIAKGNKP